MARTKARKATGAAVSEPAEKFALQNRILADLARSPGFKSGDLTRAVREVTEAAARILDVDRAGIWLYTPARYRIRCIDLFQRSKNLHSSGVELSAADYPVYFRELQTQRSIPAHDARTDPRTREFTAGYLVPLGITSMLDAPILREGRIAGVICHEHVGPRRTWTREEKAFAGSMADAVALALETADRGRAQDALQNRERFLGTLLDTLTGAAYRCRHDEQRTMDFISQGALPLTGHTPSDFVEGKVSFANQVVHPDHRQAAADAIRKAVERQLPYQITYQIRTARGEIKWVWDQGRGVRSPSGNLEALEGYLSDITEFQDAQERLRDQHSQFSSLLKSFQDFFYTIDDERRFVIVMGGWTEIYKTRPDALIGRTASEALDPGAARVHEQAHARAVAGEVVVYDWSVGAPGGERHFQTTLNPIRDVEGHVHGATGAARDVTGLTRALRERDGLFRLSFDLAGPLAPRETGWKVASMCRRLFAHDAFFISMIDDLHSEVTPFYAEDTAPGAQAPEEVSMGDAGPPSALLLRLVREGRGLRINSLPDAGGTPLNSFGHTFRISQSRLFAPIRWKQKVMGYISVQSYTENRYDDDDLRQLQAIADLAGNVVERIRVEDRLRRNEEQLRQSHKMEAVGRLAGGVAHDFNNFLTVITGYGGILAGSLAEGSPERGHLDDILHAVGRAAILTRQLLAFSRKQVMTLSPVNLNEVITGMQRLLRSLVGEESELLFKLDPAAGFTRCESAQIEQVVMNLATNARDAGPKGVTITIETANAELDAAVLVRHPDVKPGRYVRFTVSDTGSGMDARVLSHLFEPFFTTKEQGKGTGLGLSTLYGIVKQLGGHIDVYSEVGTGSTFKIYLPRCDAPSPRDARPSRSPSTRRMAAVGAETVLLVEDQDIVRKLAHEVIRSHGYTVLEASNGEEALKLAEGHKDPIDLLVTDVVMPQMGGRELALRLLKTRPSLRILYMSGYTADSAEQLGSLEPGSEFLEKPFSPTALAAKVRKALDAPRG